MLAMLLTRTIKVCDVRLLLFMILAITFLRCQVKSCLTVLSSFQGKLVQNGQEKKTVVSYYLMVYDFPSPAFIPHYTIRIYKIKKKDLQNCKV